MTFEKSLTLARVTSNSQGELSPLEIGLHALRCVQLSDGGRGRKGGLSAYAEAIGRAKSTITEYVNAARVIENCSVDRTVLQSKTQHLAAIHALPSDCWPAARREPSRARSRYCPLERTVLVDKG